MASFVRMGQEIPRAPWPVVLAGKQDWAERLEKTSSGGANHLLSMQAEEGYWQGELEADTPSNPITLLFVRSGKADSGAHCQARKLRTPSATRDGAGPSIWRAFGAERYLQSIFRLESWRATPRKRAHLVQARENRPSSRRLEHTNSYVRF